MNAPYNHNPYAAPLAPPVTLPAEPARPDQISHLGVSESWKRRFHLIEKAGGVRLPHFRTLSFGERMSVNFNWLGFLFGPFYYLCKGLWRQAIVYSTIAVALILLLEVIGLGRFSRVTGYGFGALYARLANISYYRKVVLGETRWI